MTIFNIIQEWADKPFEYGMDCCQFVAACVEDRTGRNPMAAFKYSNEDEALAIISRYGSLGAAIRATLGDSIPVDQAKDGDVLLVNIRQNLPYLAEIVGDEIAAVCWKGRAVVKTFNGVTDWPLNKATEAWRV